MSVKVSVIVPVYNAEKTLEKCMNSLLSQTLEDIEIVAVNDMSTDGSREMLESYKHRYPEKVKVIDVTTKQYAGGARNCGMEAAEGTYVGFVDADDFVDPAMYQELYEKAKEGYDIVDSAIYEVKSGKATIAVADELCGECTWEKKRQLMVVGGYIVTKIYRRDFLTENGIKFRHGVKLEDADFLMKVYINAKKIANVRKVFYVYNNENSLDTWSVRSLNKSEYDNLTALMTEIKKIHDIKEYSEVHEVLEASALRMYVLAIQCCTAGGKLEKNDLDMLRKVKKIKAGIVKNGYDNKYIKGVLTAEDIELMRYIDKNF